MYPYTLDQELSINGFALVQTAFFLFPSLSSPLLLPHLTVIKRSPLPPSSIPTILGFSFFLALRKIVLPTFFLRLGLVLRLATLFYVSPTLLCHFLIPVPPCPSGFPHHPQNERQVRSDGTFFFFARLRHPSLTIGIFSDRASNSLYFSHLPGGHYV